MFLFGTHLSDPVVQFCSWFHLFHHFLLQARTVGELEEEEEEEQAAEAAAAQVVSDDEDNEVPYNPKNVPLDWNGKVGIFRI